MPEYDRVGGQVDRVDRTNYSDSLVDRISPPRFVSLSAQGV
ncbi:hypothetical protein Q5692_33965 [Microcoleus sp. C2C3]